MRAFCKCGCGQRVKHVRCQWATPTCVPREFRQANGRASRRVYAYNCRRRLFEAQWQKLKGRTITREDLFAILMEVYLKGRQARRQELCRERKAA